MLIKKNLLIKINSCCTDMYLSLFIYHRYILHKIRVAHNSSESVTERSSELELYSI